MGRGAWEATVCGVARVRHDLVTKPPSISLRFVCKFLWCLWAAKSLSPVKKRTYILPLGRKESRRAVSAFAPS